MKILILNGSPKGNKSITLQYVEYIKKNYAENEFTTYNVAQEIKKIEKDESYFQEIITNIEKSDLVLWSFPLYFMLVCSQYKRFIELITEKKAQSAFNGKNSAAISTSIHFYDHTAHNYINAISDDLDMNYLGYYSADVHDLLKEEKRENLLTFADNIFSQVKSNAKLSKNYQTIKVNNHNYIPAPINKKIDSKNNKIVIVSDESNTNSNLSKMIETCQNSFNNNVEVINLHDVDIKGGCLGCIKCGDKNICAYQGKDQYIEMFNQKLKTADILIFAGTIKDRYLSSKWKEFFDRSFFNTHQPSLAGKQFAFLISGPLNQVQNLKQILETQIEISKSNLVRFITDEEQDSKIIDSTISNTMQQLVSLSETNYIKPNTFLGVGGTKIFRDDIWGNLRFVFPADYKYYKKHKYFDFPQKNYKVRLTNKFMGLLKKIPAFKNEFYKNITTHMVRPFKKVIESSK